MGLATNKRVPLPAPTDDGSDSNSEDLATNVSRATDKSSFSIPDDGSPITIPTKASYPSKTSSGAVTSQTSLLIEYFEGGRPKENTAARPNVRVRVRPSSRKSESNATDQGRKPSYTRRISISADPQSATFRSLGKDTENIDHNNNDHISPIQADLENQDPLSPAESPTRAIYNASEISSMPADSMLDAPLGFKDPEPLAERSINDKNVDQGNELQPEMDTLKAPDRTRSISRDRILRKAAEKVSQEARPEESGVKRTPRVSKERYNSGDIIEDAYADYKARSRQSSKSYSRPDSGDYRSVTTSSVQRNKDVESNVSGASRSSLANNPKLLQTVEDAIRRLILPEINEIKRQQSVNQGDREDSRNLSKSTSAPQIKRKSNRSKGSYDDTVRETDRERRSKGREYRRSSDGSEALTTAALKDHNARSRDRERRERRERRKKRSKSGSRTDSVPVTDESPQDQSKIPPMPLASENDDSDITRESILSVETPSAELQRPNNKNAEGSRELPFREVAGASPTDIPILEPRDSSKTPLASGSRIKTPTQPEQFANPSRSLGSRGELKSTRSDRSISNKARAAALAAAGIGGAASAVYGLDRHKPSRSHSRGTDQPISYNQDVSPVQSTGSQRDLVSPLNESTEARPVSRVSSEFELLDREPVERSLDQKHQLGANQENGSKMISPEPSPLVAPTNDSKEDDFYREQQQINDEYRSSMELEGPETFNVPEPSPRQLELEAIQTNPEKDNSPNVQQVRGFGVNAEYVDTSDGPESAVASVHDPSQLSATQSFEASNRELAPDSSTKEYSSQHSPQQKKNKSYDGPLLSEHQSFSRDRWVALRESARALSGSKDSLDNDSQQLSSAHSEKSEEIQMTSSGLPRMDDPMPEIGHGVDVASDSANTPSTDRKQSSILDSPLGDENENRDHWPYEPTPPNKRHGWVGNEDNDEQYVSAGNAALMGAAAGLGIGAAGLVADNSKFDRKPSGSVRNTSSRSSGSMGAQSLRDTSQEAPRGPAAHSRVDYQETTPGNLKDEGYVSAAQPRSPDSITPLSFSKPPPKLFADRNQDRDISYSSAQDPFISDKRARYLSGNSHGMSSPYFDASTGKGMNNIQSKDVVALMDHLTVRDGQRNARDTEILVTLVRSAAEMHNSFDEMKKLIQSQGDANLQTTEKGINRILQAPKPQVLGSPRNPGSSEDVSGKRKNIFKRALGGLSSKSSNDISRLEDMLMQLLNEVEGLKEAQAFSTRSMSAAPQESLDSYERLRAAPESGYEPEGHAGTSSTPNWSGYFTPQPRQTQQRMHSGYETGRENDKRVSTVIEHDEDLQETGDEERLLTPTQEAQKQRAAPSNVTPQGNYSDYNYESTEVTPVQDDRYRKTKSGSSSLWGGIPRISRWSKTTSSSDNRTSIGTTPGRVKDRPYSELSRSGSDINVLPPDGEPWMLSEDDRLRSANSLAREAGASQSPGVQVSTVDNSSIPRTELEDPKYKANRNSLTLQHPQPRQGNTPRHKSHLENEAFTYGGNQESRDLDDNGDFSPNSDTFGSMPSLARLPGGGIAMHRQNATYHSRNIQAQNSSPLSAEDDYQGQRDSYSLPQTDKTRQEHQVRYLNDSEMPAIDSDEDSNEWGEDTSIPLPRKRSPYAPGGLLAPIEERYSMEGDRSSIGYSLSQRSRRESIDAKLAPPGSSGGTGTGNTSVDLSKSEGLADVAEMDETERAITPNTNPQPALGAAGGEVRKLTGPREMPRKESGETGRLRGTLRRKPAADVSED